MDNLKQLFDKLHSVPTTGGPYESFRAIKLILKISRVAEQEFRRDYELLEYGNPQSYVVVPRAGTVQPIAHMVHPSYSPHFAWFSFAELMVNAQQEEQNNAQRTTDHVVG